MALKLATPFPLFAPQLNPYSCPNQSVNPNSSTHRTTPGEVRFSRWNNANAERFEERRRTQKEIEDEIRIQRRFNSAARIADTYDSVATTTSSPAKNEVFRSVGTPSSPSNPSIPGKKSKYSKNPSSDSHPAFRRLSKTKKRSVVPMERPAREKATVGVGEDGVSFLIDGAPFEYKYSYTETPKVRPIKLREPAFAPFGPTTMPRPWTGRAPLPPSKKKLKEFDSFQLPPPNKKGVKPVQAPGPFLPGSGPKYVKSREEILGEPLTKEEVAALVKSCLKTKRQLNMGRDGLTHNMLDNIHAHWKRRRVCKIKCKGVCTVDMDNVREQLEERTGGKIIFSIGGVLYLFRGRNYNYRTRPRFPLMLWKPITPVYPRLIRRVPEGLTLEEASEMRMKGRSLLPITRLGKNGVYSNLVSKVREAFEACELVRINCEGMNGSDFRKIGAKLKDLVPCVLISFESEHILMWRGRDWRSSFPTEVIKDNKSSSKPELEEASAGFVGTISDYDTGLEQLLSENEGPIDVEYDEEDEVDLEEDEYSEEDEVDSEEDEVDSEEDEVDSEEDELESDEDERDSDEEATMKALENMVTIADKAIGNESNYQNITSNDPSDDQAEQWKPTHQQDLLSEASNNISCLSNTRCTEVIRSLLHRAVENGSAIVLEEEFCLDADVVYRRAVALAESAPSGPVFKQHSRKVVTKTERETEGGSEVREEIAVVVNKRKEKSFQPRRKKNFGEHFLQVVPTGSLGIDELAKLLA